MEVGTEVNGQDAPFPLEGQRRCPGVKCTARHFPLLSPWASVVSHQKVQPAASSPAW